jgi:hypothetical protein
MVTSEEYAKPVRDYLAELGVTVKVERLGESCPPYCEQINTPYPDPRFPRKTHIHGDHHLVTVVRSIPGRMERPAREVKFTYPFWDSYVDSMARWLKKNRWKADELSWSDKSLAQFNGLIRRVNGHGIVVREVREWNGIPSEYDVLSCLPWFHEPSFKHWCKDFGYSDDSIKARDIHQAETDLYHSLCLVFSGEERVKLQELAA